MHAVHTTTYHAGLTLGYGFENKNIFIDYNFSWTDLTTILKHFSYLSADDIFGDGCSDIESNDNG